MYGRYPTISYHSKAGIILALLVVSSLFRPGYSRAQTSKEQRIAALSDSGIVCLEKGDINEAYRLVRLALNLNSNSPRALLCMGRVMLNVPTGGQRAIEHLKRAVILQPENIEARYHKALAHIRLSKTELGFDDSQLALKEIEAILALNPSHPDAYYRRGIVLRDTYRDYRGAAEAFDQQVFITPEHMSARIALLKAQMDMGGWEAAVAAAESILAQDPNRWEAYPYLVAAYWKAGSDEEAMQVFESYFAVLPEDERDLYFDLGLILSPIESEEFNAFNEEGRQAFSNHYWRARDPDPETDINERLLEHYIRVAYARIEFGEHAWPWDDRGAFLIRYGEPDISTGRGWPYAIELIMGERWGVGGDWDFHIRARDLRRELGLPLNQAAGQGPGSQLGRMRDASGTPMSGTFFTPEEWFYTDLGLHVSFVDPISSGRYLIGDESRMLVEVMEKRVPSISMEEYRIENIHPLDYLVTFRGEGGKTAVEYVFALLPDDFISPTSMMDTYAKVNVEVDLYTEAWEQIAGTAGNARLVEIIPHFRIRGVPFFVDATRMEAVPGTYRIAVLFQNTDTGRLATTEELVELPDYSSEELLVSDILPAFRITEVGSGKKGPFIRGNLEVLPLPGRAFEFSQTLFIYYEIYNLSKDEFGATDYRTDYSIAVAPYEESLFTQLFHGVRRIAGIEIERAIVTSSFTRSGIQRDISTHLEIDFSPLVADIDRLEIYELELRITDNITGYTASSSLVFRLLPDW